MAKAPIYFSNLSYVDQPGVLITTGKRYSGVVSNIQLTKVFIKLDKPDAGIMSLPRTAPLKFEFTFDDGIIYSMTSFLVSKKLPEVEIEITEKIQNLGEARTNPRVKCQIWAEIMNAKRGEDNQVVFEAYSDCTIIDVSIGGVKIVTGNDFPIDKVIVLAFFFDKLDRKIFFRGTVKNRKKGGNDLINYGLEFYKPDDGFDGIVKQIIENPNEV